MTNTVIYILIFTLVTSLFSIKDKTAKEVRIRFIGTAIVYCLLIYLGSLLMK